MSGRVQIEPQITALLIAPNRDLAHNFWDTTQNQGVPNPGGPQKLSSRKLSRAERGN